MTRDEPRVFGWLDFDSLPIQLGLMVQAMVDEWESYAEDREIDIHSEIFNNFHPILASQGSTLDRPNVSWPVTRVEMYELSHLTAQSDTRSVMTRRIDQSAGSWLVAVDRVVVVDVITNNSPTVMTVLENPFASFFRELGGLDFVERRFEILNRFFAWPSENVSYHSSMVSMTPEKLSQMVKWLEVLGTVKYIKEYIICKKFFKFDEN